MSSGLSKAYGRAIRVYQCDARGLNGRAALYIENDGEIQGSRVMQYQIEKSPTETITVTATLKDTTLRQTRADFQRMMGSLKF